MTSSRNKATAIASSFTNVTVEGAEHTENIKKNERATPGSKERDGKEKRKPLITLVFLGLNRVDEEESGQGPL